MTITTQPLLERLRHRFSPRRIRLGIEQSEIIEDGGSRVREFQVPRELCLFLSVDLTGVPAKQRESLVSMAVTRAAPFSDPAYEVAWQGDRAAVWYWPMARIAALTGGLGRRDHVVAEALRLGQPRDQGAELLTLPIGHEGRLWRGGTLLASRWWASPPSDADWATFVRGAGFDASTVAFPLTTPAIRQRAPWQSRDMAGLKRLAEDAGTLVPQAKRYGLFFLAMAFGWQLGGALHARWGLHVAQGRIAELTTALEPVLTARSETDAHREAIDGLLSLRPPAPQLMLLAEASRLMEGSGWRVILWTQPNENSLEVRFNAPQMDGETIVSAWEASPWFESVTPALDPQGASMTLQAKLTPRKDQQTNEPAAEPEA